MNREDFKIFENYKKEHGSPLVYLDSAASSLTPDIVVFKIAEFYQHYKSNLDRGLYKNALRTKEEFEASRKVMADFIAAQEDDIIFTSGSTDSANKLTLLLEANLELCEGDEILTTVLEHHSSLLPLQELANRKKLNLIYLSLEDMNNLEVSLKSKLNSKTKIVNITHVSNVTGSIFDIASVSKIIREFDKEIFVISDLTAAAGHIGLSVADLEIGAGYFSLHKMFGPSGVGVLYLKRDVSRTWKPIFFGGGMVSDVGKLESHYRSDVRVFEAGTNNLADIIAAKEAVHYIEKIGIEKIARHNQGILEYALTSLKNNFENKIKIYCEENINKNAGIISFDVVGVHPHDVAEVLAHDGIAIRAGHHCTKLLMDDLGVSALSRVSVNLYNNKEDIDALVESLKKVINVFKV